jgi:hypothetical protein
MSRLGPGDVMGSTLRLCTPTVEAGAAEVEQWEKV